MSEFLKEQTPEEILEAKKEEIEEDLKKITDAFLENADEEELKKREEAQEKLTVLLENEEITDDEKKLSDAIRFRNGLIHRNWAEDGFPRDEYDPEMAEYIPSEELHTQVDIINKIREKLYKEKGRKIISLTCNAYPEFRGKQREWEK